MEKYIYDNSNGLWYELHGDYYLPCLTIPEEEIHTIGVWGRKHQQYLKEYRPMLYNDLVLSGNLYSYLSAIDTTPTFILGYETNTAPIRSLADIMNFLFELDKVSSLKFNVDVQKPPRSNEWTCSIRFNGKEMDADHNADMCLFLEQWEEMREDMRSYNCTPAALHSWQEQTLAYYAGASVECVEPEELDEDERLARRRAYLEKEFGSEK